MCIQQGTISLKGHDCYQRVELTVLNIWEGVDPTVIPTTLQLNIEEILWVKTSLIKAI